MPPNDANAEWTVRCREAIARYSGSLLREVAARLVRPRTNQPSDELLEKSSATLTNPPVIDRRLRELPVASRRLITLVGLSGQPRWRVGHLMSLLSALGIDEGFAPIEEGLRSGLIYPYSSNAVEPIEDFTAWLGRSGSVFAQVFVHPLVASRIRDEDLGLPDLAEPEDDTRDASIQPADGLDWPLRLAALWQRVLAAPVRHTQSGALFKKDLTRLQSDEVLSGAWSGEVNKVADAGVLALRWAAAAGLLSDSDNELTATPFPSTWESGLTTVLEDLLAALPLIEEWDPLGGYTLCDGGLSPAPTAGLLTLLLLARAKPGAWVKPQSIAEWLWTHHPTWAGRIPKDGVSNKGFAWVFRWLSCIAQPLGLIDLPREDEGPVRLSKLGRQLLGLSPNPSSAPTPAQTLLVQPNAEIVAYRQGLTPALVAMLSRFARWTGLGPACTLELSADQIHWGLETGLTLPMILQFLARHASRPIPAPVADLLQRWASKRERMTVFTSAVLVEFATPGELDAAINRGIVSLRLTDRVGMTADGSEPGLNQLRLLANRDYEAKPQQCVRVDEDGVTLTVDLAASDLLLDAEIARFTAPLPSQPFGPRRYLLSGKMLRRAAESLAVADIDEWFLDRTGQPLSPAGRLFLIGPQSQSPIATRLLAVRFPSVELADGAMQWPETRKYIAERLGPTIVAVEEENLTRLRSVLSGVGIDIQ